MTEKKAQENPAQPFGWGNPPSEVSSYAPGELAEIEQQKRQDTAQWEDANDANPIANEGNNPAQPAGPYVPEYAQVPASPANEAPDGPTGLSAAASRRVMARVFVGEEAETVRGAKVLLRDKEQGTTHVGRVVAAVGKDFWVKWQDGQDSIEKKADYELIRTEEESDEE